MNEIGRKKVDIFYAESIIKSVIYDVESGKSSTIQLLCDEYENARFGVETYINAW